MSGGTRLGVAEQLPYGPALPSAPIAPVAAPQQKGGAYGTVLAPLNPSNGVGSSALPTTQNIPCALRYPPTMRGGAAFSPQMEVSGAADMSVYRAPNAGYTNVATLIPHGATPAVMNPVGYPAGAFNRACLTTGGAAPVIPDSAEFGNRMDFDGTNGSLPVKYGGGRRKRSMRHKRKTHHKRKSHHKRK
jgi:hypothetical protein